MSKKVIRFVNYNSRNDPENYAREIDAVPTFHGEWNCKFQLSVEVENQLFSVAYEITLLFVFFMFNESLLTISHSLIFVNSLLSPISSWPSPNAFVVVASVSSAYIFNLNTLLEKTMSFIYIL